MDLFTKAGIITCRDYQEAAVDAVIAALKRKINPVVCAATGTGKSIMIGRLIERIKKANPAARIMMATHVSELIEQNKGKLESLLPTADIGIYSAALGEKEYTNEIVFAGIQSIYRNKKLGLFNILIVDEAHTIGRKDASMWGALISTLRDNNPNLMMVGFSATPFRMDSGSLTDGDDALFDEIVFDYGLGRAIQDGYLCPLTAKYTETKYDVSGVGKLAGEYNLKQLEAATNVDGLTQAAVAEMVKKAADRKSWLIFCNGVAHSFAIRDEIRRHGITCETVTGETPDNERARILAGFKDGSIRAVTNNAVWTTGIDVPGVDMIGMLRHTMSGGLLLQMAGRGTRTTADLTGLVTAKERKAAIAASDKPNVLFMDFAGNIERHGFLDQIKAKEKGKKGDGVAPMKACPDCFTICHAAARKCPDCGHEFPMNTETQLGGLYQGQVMGGEPLTKDVVSVSYSPHNVAREGKIPCLRVKYLHPEGDSTTEYICLQHTGFAKQKADKWWADRDTLGVVLDGMEVVKIYDDGYCTYLKQPKSITVKKDGKYDRVIAYHDLTPPAPPSPAKADDEAWEIVF